MTQMWTRNIQLEDLLEKELNELKNYSMCLDQFEDVMYQCPSLRQAMK